jgi:Secretion system C-terminal sorting domain
MKKLMFTFSFILSVSYLFANVSVIETYFSFSLNSGAEYYKGAYGGINPEYSGSSIALNLNPNINTLVLKLRGIHTYQTGGSIVYEVKMKYRVYKVGTTIPAFTVVDIPQATDDGVGGRKWQTNAPNINLLSGVRLVGTHIVDITFDVITNGVNTLPLFTTNAGSSGSVATFTTNTALATELVSFQGTKHNNIINLAWVTASEKSNEYFSIERSKDGENFTSIGQIKGAFNSTISKFYDYQDIRPMKGINYYRLKSMEAGGIASFSKIVSVSLSDKNIKTSVFPNPVTESVLQIEHETASEGSVLIKIIDLMGRAVLTKKITVISGYNLINLDVDKLTDGQYLISIEDQLIKFMKH